MMVQVVHSTNATHMIHNWNTAVSAIMCVNLQATVKRAKRQFPSINGPLLVQSPDVLGRGKQLHTTWYKSAPFVARLTKIVYCTSHHNLDQEEHQGACDPAGNQSWQ